MNTVKLCGIAIISVMLIVTLKQLRPEFSSIMAIGTGIILFSCALTCFSPATDLLGTFADGMSGEAFENFSPHIGIMIKSLGVGMLAQSTADICRDSGESSIASKIELIGKAEIFVMSIPLITELLDITRGLMM